MTKVNLNLSVIESAAIAAFKDSCYLLDREFTQVISEPGAFPGFPQDLVDQNGLRSSQDLQFVKLTEARWSWNVDYALVLHEGAEFQTGQSWQVQEHQRTQKQAFGKAIAPKKVTVSAHTKTRRNGFKVEGRPWTKLSLERFDFEGTFNKLLAAKLK